MSTEQTEALPAVPPAPARRSIPAAARAGAARPSQAAQPSPFADWRDRCPTEQLPVTPVPTAPYRERRERPSPRPLRRHLRAALAGILIAAALLTGLQLYAAAGISSARQAALAARAEQATEQPAPTPPAQPGQAEAPASQWVVEGTATAAPSPLDLPRCTTSPDTPLPCLATISPDSRRAVVLEEDASLTALVLR